MIKKVLLVIGIVFLFGFETIEAQQNSAEVPLIDILLKLEDTFNIQLSFADKNIDGKSLIAPNFKDSKKNVISYIENVTDLKFVAINDTSYAIKTNNEALNFVALQNLQKVIITRYLTKGIKLNDDATTTITPKYFDILPGLIEPDILQTIQALPGIQSVDERISDLTIRGGTNDQNLILWEGIKMYQTGHFFGLISAFNPFLVDNVTVSKNGTSTIYGEGVSSVIDIRNINDITGKFSSGFGVNLINADAYGIIPLNKKLELQLSARRSITDLWTSPTYDSYFNRVFQDTDLTNELNNLNNNNEQFSFYDVSAKLLYQLNPKDKFSASVINIENSLDYEEESINSQNSLNSNLQQNSFAATLHYNRQWNDFLMTNAQVYVSNYKLESTNIEGMNNQQIFQENDVTDTGLKIDVNYKLSDNINYLGGYQFSEISVTNIEQVNIPDFKRFVRDINRQHAIFNEIKFTSNSSKTILKLGLRNNFFSELAQFNVEPRITFNQKLGSDFRLEVLGELKSQTTSQIIDLQDDFLGVEKRRWVLSNDRDIPITKSSQVSAGIHFEKNKLLVSLETYFKEVTGITTRNQGFQNQFQFVNAEGKYTIKGIDFLINKKFKNLSSWLTYSYNENDYVFEDLNNGDSFPNNVAFNHALTFSNTWSLKQFNLGLGLNWRTGKPYSRPLSNQSIANNMIIYGAPNAQNLPDYFRIDASVRYNFKINKNIKASSGISLWNISNKNNVLNKRFVINDQNSINEIENQSLGLTPNFNFRIDF